MTGLSEPQPSGKHPGQPPSPRVRAGTPLLAPGVSLGFNSVFTREITVGDGCDSDELPPFSNTAARAVAQPLLAVS